MGNKKNDELRDTVSIGSSSTMVWDIAVMKKLSDYQQLYKETLILDLQSHQTYSFTEQGLVATVIV